MNEIDSNAIPEFRATNGAELPLRAPPLVFAIDNGDGTTENLWGVDIVQGRPVVYCGCRYPFDDGMWREPHVLIQSGGDNAAVAVSILRLRPGAAVRGIDGRPVSPIGVFALERNSSLHVVVETDARERVERARSLISNVPSDRDDWDEDDMEGLIADLGSDEVGFATLIRMPVVLTS